MLSCAAPSSMQPGTLSQPWAGLLQQEPPVVSVITYILQLQYPRRIIVGSLYT